MTDLIGQMVDRYHILKQLGQGGMATVYLAFDSRLERKVAIKVIRQSAFPAEMLDRILKRFEREAKALARLNHANIVGIIDYGNYDGAPYIVMPFIPSGTLKEKFNHPISYTAAAHILAPIARALAYAHDQDIVHRDVKPSNILITQSGDPMLTDFGIAKLLEEMGGNTLTGTGMGLGTPEYMAPEQWCGKAEAFCDQYALGVIFFELITGKKPYTADTPPAVMLKQATEPLPHPSQFLSDIPEEVEFVILKMLSKNTVDRYESMHHVAKVLEKLSREGPEMVAEKNLFAHPMDSSHLRNSTSTLEKEASGAPKATTSAKKESGKPAKKHRKQFLFAFAGATFVLVFVVALFLVIKNNSFFSTLSTASFSKPTENSERSAASQNNTLIEPIETATTTTSSADIQPIDASIPETKAAKNIDDVEKAVFQLLATGTINSVDEGLVLNDDWGGSGFFIDSAGIGVTNNHVVAGAAILKAYIHGESTPRDVRVLGTSECADLAVIQIEGSDFTYLEWFEDEVQTGQEVFAAGFPLAEPDFNLTKGIISKEVADGQTTWSSLSYIYEHDADINPGNSGGPLLTSDGKVVGINYMMRDEFDQQFAIPSELAMPMIDQLREGQNITAIGLDGRAILFGPNGEYPGIWVNSVTTGGIAHQAGIKPGDIINKVEYLVIASDGSMRDYCDILRSHNLTDELKVFVYRWETDELLEGSLNGNPLSFVGYAGLSDQAGD
ncbi:MAG: protein kinase [Anaerolineaceae bacterium]|nr:protein kinase [Anaerolineaceae bacterium]